MENLSEQPTDADDAPVHCIVMLLTRIAEALERAYPPPSPPKEKKPRKFKTPVVLFESVPQRVKVWQDWMNFSGEGEQCAATTFVSHTTPNYHRCMNGRAGSDGLCGAHRKQSESTGVKDWQDVYGEKFKSTERLS